MNNVVAFSLGITNMGQTQAGLEFVLAMSNILQDIISEPDREENPTHLISLQILLNCAIGKIRQVKCMTLIQDLTALTNEIRDFIPKFVVLESAESKSLYGSIFALLDHLIFQQYEATTAKKPAYLDRFTQPVLPTIALDLFGRFQKFTITAYNFAKNPSPTFPDFAVNTPTIAEVVRRRIEELSVATHAITLMPEYMMRVRQLATGITIFANDAYLGLADKCLESFIKRCYECLLDDQGKLGKSESDEEWLGKTLLSCYLYSHLPVASEAMKKRQLTTKATMFAESTNGDENKDEKLKLLIEGNFDPALKVIQAKLHSEEKLGQETACLAFCNQLANLFALESRLKFKIIEENADSIAELLLAIYSKYPNVIDLRFRSSLASFLLSISSLKPRPTLLKHEPKLQKLIEDIWFDEKVMERESSSYFSPILDDFQNLLNYSFTMLGSSYELIGLNKDSISRNVKKDLLIWLDQIKKSISSMNRMSVDILQDRASNLHLGVHKRRIGIQLHVFSQILERNMVHLGPDQQQELRDQLLNLREVEFGLLGSLEKELFEIARTLKSATKEAFSPIDRSREILNLISNMSGGYLKMFIGDSEIKNAKREDIEEYGRLNALAFGYVEEVKIVETTKKEPKKRRREQRDDKQEARKTTEEQRIVLRKPILDKTVFSSLKAANSIDQKILSESLRKIIKFFASLESLKSMKAAISKMQESIFGVLFKEVSSLDELFEEALRKLEITQEGEDEKATWKFMFAFLKFMRLVLPSYNDNESLDLALKTNILKNLPRALKIGENLSTRGVELSTGFSVQKFFTRCMQCYSQIKNQAFKKGILSTGPLKHYPLSKKAKLEGLKDEIEVGRKLFLDINLSRIDLFSTKHLAKLDKELPSLIEWEEATSVPKDQQPNLLGQSLRPPGGGIILTPSQPIGLNIGTSLAPHESHLGGLGANPLGIAPLTSNPLGSLGSGQLGSNPLGSNPLGTSPLTSNPQASLLGTYSPLVIAPLTSNPLGTLGSGPNPLGSGPLGSVPLGGGLFNNAPTPNLLMASPQNPSSGLSNLSAGINIFDSKPLLGNFESLTATNPLGSPLKDTDNTLLSKNSLPDETITINDQIELQRKLTEEFIANSFKRILNQLIIIIGCSEKRESALAFLKTLFEKLSSEQEFQQHLINLTQEANNILKRFFGENTEEKCKIQDLPEVVCSSNSDFNILMRVVFYLKFIIVVTERIPEGQRNYIPSEFQKEFIPKQGNKLLYKLYSLADERLQKAWNENVIFNVMSDLSMKPTYYRFELNIGLWNKCSYSEFKKEEHDTLDLIYEGAKFVLINPQLFNEEAIMLECQNLLSLMIWNKVYSEKVIREGLITKLLSLQNGTKSKIVPYMLDMLISEQIPIENRVEIALKGAFLRGGSILLMDKMSSLQCLEPLLRINPEAFYTKFHQILTAKEIEGFKKNFASEEEEKKEKPKKEDEMEEEEEEESTIKIAAAEYGITLAEGKSKLLAH